MDAFASAPDLNARVRLLSDDVLYPEAVRFVREHCQDRLPRPAQVHGLLQFSQSWDDWRKFIDHQKARPEHPDRDFYSALAKWNESCRKRAKEEWRLVSPKPTKAEVDKELNAVCGLLVAEFAQHLTAELLRSQALRAEH